MPDPARQTSDEATAAAPLQPVIGGTLLLLSFYARTPHLGAADRIAHNLALIARHPDACDGLQRICAQLFASWIGPLQPQDEPPEDGWRDVWPMPAATQ